jgi:superfamily II DNA/RNA helicase
MIKSADVHRPSADVCVEWVDVDEHEKMATLVDTLKTPSDPLTHTKTIVFCNTVEHAERVYDVLSSQLADIRAKGDLRVCVLHKQLFADTRSEQIELFEGEEGPSKRVLVATNLAMRGFDFKRVSHVIQYDCATNVVEHLHRIGRTGRLDPTAPLTHSHTQPMALGRVTCFVSPKDRDFAAAVQAREGQSLEGLFSRKRALRRRLKPKKKDYRRGYASHNQR